MKIDRFTKVCLLAIVVLLSILVVRTMFETKESYAAKGVEYKVIGDLPKIVNVRSGDEEIFFKGTETVLNQYGKQGWELVEYFDVTGGWAILKR